MTHQVVDVELRPEGYVAVCGCGLEFVGRRLDVAEALHDAHVDEVSRPVCPTPDKQSYPDRERAETALRTIWSGGARAPGGVGRKFPSRIYQCPCGDWHLTSMPKALRKEA